MIVPQMKLCLADYPFNQILMNKLYNALFMRSQNPQKKFLHLFCLAKKNFFCGDAE